MVFTKGESNVLPQEFYVRDVGLKSIPSLKHQSLQLPKGEVVVLDTYYNMFPIVKWKDFCEIADLSFDIRGQGKVRLCCCYIDAGVTPRCIVETDIDLQDNVTSIDIKDFPKFRTGYLYIKIKALTDCVLSGDCGFSTSSPILNDIRMGLVITHYNRKEHILPVLRKLTKEISCDEFMSKHVKVLVVDNSSNIYKEDISGIDNLRVIPNANLGGSGGYARGLLYLKDHNFSHCLYTDDDVLFEPESIRRTLTFLSYSKEKKLAVVGAIFSEDLPYSVLQIGALFNPRGWIGLNSGLNFSDPYQVILADQSLIQADYGAWPFFAFPIAEVKHFPFPFFVRGDDVLFGIQNKFLITSLNGVGVTVGNIIHREGPMSLYQDTRAILTINCIKNTGLLPTIKVFTALLLSQLLSYKYGSVQAVLKAFEDVWQGPDFFAKNIDCISIRKTLKKYAELETFTDLDCCPDAFPVQNQESRYGRIIRLLSLNGVLLPKVFIKKQSVYQLKAFKANLRQIYKYQKVYYYCPYTRRFLVVSMEKKLIIKYLFLYLKCIIKIIFQFKHVKDLYAKNTSHVGSEQFWRSVYKDQ